MGWLISVVTPMTSLQWYHSHHWRNKVEKYTGTLLFGENNQWLCQDTVCVFVGKFLSTQALLFLTYNLPAFSFQPSNSFLSGVEWNIHLFKMWYDLAQEYPTLSGKVQKEIFRDKAKKILVLPDCQAEIWKMLSSCLLFLFLCSKLQDNFWYEGWRV